MARGLLHWIRRDDVPAGRHARAFPMPTLPGAAATIVASAAQDPRVRPGVWFPEVTAPAAATDRAWDPASGAIGLVFADGARVELDGADPRAASLREAASALLNPS